MLNVTQALLPLFDGAARGLGIQLLDFDGGRKFLEARLEAVALFLELNLFGGKFFETDHVALLLEVERVDLIAHARELLVAVAACVGLRLGFLLLVEPWALATEAQAALHNDSQGYHRLALSLLERGEFTTEAGVPANTLRTPGYPLFVAALYSLFGPRPWAVMLSHTAKSFGRSVRART